MWSPKWWHNACLVAEHATLLALIQSIVENTKEMDTGRTIIHIDSLTVHDNKTKIKVKASSYAGDGSAIISKIRRITKNTKVEIDCMHVNTKMITDDIRNTVKAQLLLQCDIESKRVRFTCKKENRE